MPLAARIAALLHPDPAKLAPFIPPLVEPIRPAALSLLRCRAGVCCMPIAARLVVAAGLSRRLASAAGGRRRDCRWQLGFVSRRLCHTGLGETCGHELAALKRFPKAVYARESVRASCLLSANGRQPYSNVSPRRLNQDDSTTARPIPMRAVLT